MSADPKPDPRLVFRGLVADGEHEHFYRALVEGAPAALYIDEPSVTGRTLYMSPRIETLLGYTSDELTSTVDVWLDRIVHPADRALTVAVTTDNSEGRRGAIEYRCIHKDGSVVWLHDESVPVFNDDGDVVAVHGFLQDITARRSAEQEVHEAEERYRSLVEDMPAIVYLDAPDETGSAIYLSPKVEDLFGYTREEWASAPDFFVNEILHPGDRERVLDVIACNNVGISNRSEYRCITKDGRVVWIYDEAHPQLDSDGAVVATRG